MLDAINPLPKDRTELRAVGVHSMAEVQSQVCPIEKLKAKLLGHGMARFGSNSKSPDQLAFDLAEDAEINVAAEAQKSEQAEVGVEPFKHQASRKPYWTIWNGIIKLCHPERNGAIVAVLFARSERMSQKNWSISRAALWCAG